MGDLGGATLGSFFWGGLLGGIGTFDRVRCAIFGFWPDGRGIGVISMLGTLGAECVGANFMCTGTMFFCVVGGLSLCGLGFLLVSLGTTLGDGTGVSSASGVIHFPMAFFNDAKAWIWASCTWSSFRP